MSLGDFRLPIDIANRALQHCGLPRITAFTDDAKGAAETAFSYDKVRKAELRRNAWRFAIRKVALRAVDNNTMFLVPAAYSTATTYPIGALVLWQNVIYFSTAPVPINTPPDANPDSWTVYFGNLAVSPWAPGADPNAPAVWNSVQSYPQGALVTTSDGTIWQSIINNNVGHSPTATAGTDWESVGSVNTSAGYFAGELVYVLSAGVIKIFMSLQSGNIDDPLTIAPWNATTTYFRDDTVSTAPTQVTFNGTDVDFNSVPVFFNANLFQSKIDLNLNNDPSTTDAWEPVPPTQTDVMAGQNWLQLDSTIVHRRMNYPIQAGPRNQGTTRNVFRLPSGFLKMAPQDPKIGAASYLGAPSGMPYDDWTLEGDWLVSRDQSAVIVRFVADIADVTLMDPMFCEGLGARIGLEVCEPLTQSDAKLSTISQIYKTFMGEARAINGIETGFTESPVDDYLTCRL